MEHPNVYAGKDGYLFLKGDKNNIVGQINGTYPLPDDFMTRWRDLFASRKADIAGLGMDYYFAIAPNKESVATDKLPDGMVVAAVQPRDHVIHAAAEAGLPVIFPVNELRRRHRAGEQVYSRGDTHWDAPGSFVMYEEISRVAGFRAITRDEVSFVEVSAPGDLASKIEQPATRMAARLKRKSASKVFDNQVRGTGNRIRYSNPNGCGRCLIFRDSFFLNMVSFFAETFAEVELLWQPNLERGIVEAVRPDFVLSIQAERFLVLVPDDTTMQTNAERVALKA